MNHEEILLLYFIKECGEFIKGWEIVDPPDMVKEPLANLKAWYIAELENLRDLYDGELTIEMGEQEPESVSVGRPIS